MYKTYALEGDNTEKLKQQLLEGGSSEKWGALETLVRQGMEAELTQKLMDKIINERAQQTGISRDDLLGKITVLSEEGKKKRLQRESELKKVKDGKINDLVKDKEFFSKYIPDICPKCYRELAECITEKKQECPACRLNIYQQVLCRVYQEASQIAEDVFSEKPVTVKTYALQDVELGEQVKKFSEEADVPYEKALVSYIQMDTEPGKVPVEIQFKYHKWENPGISDEAALDKIR